MIKVCDAIMGSGKTSAAINYMNEHCEDKRFLYITPYIDETARVKNACPDLNFWAPSKSIKEYDFRKSSHFKQLLSDQKNIVITHALFKMCDEETTKLVTDGGYTVIIDEAVEVFEPLEISQSDIKMMIDSGWLVTHKNGSGNDTFEYFEQNAAKQYQGGRYHDLFLAAQSKRLIKINTSKSKEMLWVWSLNKELFECSDEVIVMTYLFDYSFLRCFFDINGIEYSKIYAHRSDNGVFSFADTPSLPRYVSNLSKKIHIFENDKLNSIGKNKNALSYSWVEKEAKWKNGKIEQLRRNMVTFFRYYNSDVPADERLWSTFRCGMNKLRAKGFYRSDLAFNSKATNNYGNKRALAYCVNIFCNPNLKWYFNANGTDFDEDGYALSIMLQWIWRSAIRNGKDIYIYIPSSRMRTLLKNWIKDTENLYYKTKEGQNI